MSQGIKIGNRFTIANIDRDLLGRGGMGNVYRALDTQTGETVAVKVLHPDVLRRDPTLLERFLREGKALRQLNHPNIVHMIAALEENGCHYLVLEYVAGGSLQDVVAAGGKLPHERVIPIALDLADALTRAHRLGIIHRDLKPGNVLLAEDGTPHLADFGIAHVADISQLTQSGIVMGTIDYLSPEACRGEAPDERSDIWSFGVLLFQMLSGQTPFPGDSIVAKLNAILTRKVPDLGQLAPGTPDALIDLVYRMLEKDPQQRIPSVRLVGAELEDIWKGREPIMPSHAASAERRFATPVPAKDAPKHNLPVQSTPFVGREADLVELDRLLADRSVRLVTILGVGGMGKTRLAMEVGARQLEHFQHGVYFIPLAGIQAVEEIVTATAQALGFSFHEGREPRQQLLDYLREKKMLLIFDNFEHLLGGTSIVSDILHTASNAILLSTSRVRLGLPEEHLYHLGGMDFPTWETPVDALEYSAVKLFLQSARRVRPGFELASDDLKYVARICRLVGGMPLGILLAAAWLEMLTTAEVASEIQNNLDFLAMDLSGVDERQRSLRAVLDYSWGSLTEREQEIFQELSVFRGGFTREAVQIVTGASLHDLMGLVNKSLLVRASSGRYEIHEFLRQYGAEKLAEAPKEEHAVRDHHCGYYAEFLHQREAHLFGKNQRTVLAEIGAEVDNLRVGWEWAVAKNRVAWISNYLEGLCELYRTRGWFQEGAVLLAKAARILSIPQDNIADLETKWVLGKVLLREGRFSDTFDLANKTEERLQASVTIFRELGAQREMAYALCYRGGCESPFGKVEGEPFCERALSIFRETGDDRGMALALRGLAWVALHQATYSLAKQRFQESLNLLRRLQDQSEIVNSLGGLGYICFILGEYQAAYQYHQEMLSLCTEIGDRSNIACSMGFLGTDAFGLRDFIQAEQLWQSSLAIYREIGDAAGMADELGDMGELANLRGEYAQAFQFAQDAILEYKKIYPELITWSFTWPLRVLGNAECGLGNLPAARKYLRQSLEQTLKIRRWGQSLNGLVGVATLLAKEGKSEYALELLALVTSHHASWQMARDKAAPLLAELNGRLPADVVEAAQARGRTRNLESTIQELLVELEKDEAESIS